MQSELKEDDLQLGHWVRVMGFDAAGFPRELWVAHKAKVGTLDFILENYQFKYSCNINIIKLSWKFFLIKFKMVCHLLRLLIFILMAGIKWVLEIGCPIFCVLGVPSLHFWDFRMFRRMTHCAIRTGRKTPDINENPTGQMRIFPV